MACLKRLWAECDRWQPVRGDVQRTMRLGAIYTPLLTELNSGDLRHNNNKTSQGLPPTLGGETKLRPLSAVAVLNHHRHLVLLGGPGSGKSSFVNYVALCLAGELLGKEAPHPEPTLDALLKRLPGEEADERHASRLGEPPEPPRPEHWTLGPLLPVRVTLRDLAAQLPTAGGAADAQAVWHHLQRSLEGAALEEYAPALKAELLDHGGLVMFDGMDEVPDAEHRREAIQRAVLDFASSFSRCRVLVTCRTYAYQKQQWKLPGFVDAPLRLFTQPQIKAFVNAWYQHMAEVWPLTPEVAASRSTELLRQLQRNSRVAELARYPLLLTLLARLHEARGGELPSQREALYYDSVKLLLDDWERGKRLAQPTQAGVPEAGLAQASLSDWLKVSLDDVRTQLYRLAFHAHHDQKEKVGTADIRPADVVEALMRASAGRADINPKHLQNYLSDRAGILVENGVGMLQFPHRTFQEYLAACHLANDNFPGQLVRLLGAEPERWREATLLSAAHAARGNKALPTWALVDALCPHELTADCGAPAAWGALLAGQVLVELGIAEHPAAEHQGKLQRVRHAQVVLLRGGTLPAAERALAGRTLAALGDPRPKVMTLAGMQFLPVPAGPFQMGSSQHHEDERPLHTVNLAAGYCMARYPVTVAQWLEYLRTSGSEAQDPRSTEGPGNQPVAFVTWQDAADFCAWLTRHWLGLLPHGWCVALPSEAEWEKAARGGLQLPPTPAAPVALQSPQASVLSVALTVANAEPARAYPWGEHFDSEEFMVRANTEESGIHQRCAVGAFAAGASPYGCEDMAGQVWEWTRSVFEPYPYRPDDSKREIDEGGTHQVMLVRGGAWSVSLYIARCAYRLHGLHVNRGGGLGFRVVLRSAPVL